MTVFFTADTHFGHANIINYAKRPFDSVEVMDATLIDRWNRVVKRGDSVYHLGDFALCEPSQAKAIVAKLHGQKYLIFGNHDQHTRKNAEFLAAWVWAKDLTEIKVNSQRITLCHYAMRVWASSHYGTWQLYGHSHGSLPENPDARSTDVGVDCWGYTPVAFETLQDRMAQRRPAQVDHHVVKI